MKTNKRYSPEIRERVVRMVFEHQQEHESLWATIESISEKFGCTAETLLRGVRPDLYGRPIRDTHLIIDTH